MVLTYHVHNSRYNCIKKYSCAGKHVESFETSDMPRAYSTFLFDAEYANLFDKHTITVGLSSCIDVASTADRKWKRSVNIKGYLLGFDRDNPMTFTSRATP